MSVLEGEAYLDDHTVRSITILNLSGHSTLAWGPGADDKMQEIIGKKLAEGFIFFALEKRWSGLLPEKRVRVTNVRQAMEARRLSMDDEDFANIVAEGGVQLVKTPDRSPLRDGEATLTRDTAVIASRQTVAVRHSRGG